MTNAEYEASLAYIKRNVDQEDQYFAIADLNAQFEHEQEAERICKECHATDSDCREARCSHKGYT